MIESPHAAFVRGYGSRELLTELRGKAPVWATLTRAWCTTERTARDLVAVAERRGYVVDVESYVVLHPSKPAEPVIEQADPGRGLW